MKRCIVWCFFCLGSGVFLACSPPQLNPDAFRGAWLAKNETGPVLSETVKKTLDRMYDMGVRWVALGPEVMMQDIHQPDLTYGNKEEEEAFREFIRYAKNKGFDIFWLPRIESPSFFKPPFPFRADIEMDDEKEWAEFHDNYEKMLLYFAKFAEQEKIGMMALGLEYRLSVIGFPERWRQMIAAVRKVYKGKLTYSANWYEEYQSILFWDDLDYIGVGAYFELTDKAEANMTEIIFAWEPLLDQLRRTAEKYDKPLIFTEVGYTTFHDASRVPWKWQDELDRPISQAHQANCFRALFRVFAHEPWFQGFFIWRFYTDPSKADPRDYSPVNKEAGEVVSRWYNGP